VLALALILLLVCFGGSAPARAQAPGETVGVYYVGPEDRIAGAIDRAAPYIVRVDQADLARVIVINNAPLRESLEAFSADIQQERVGLVLFCGSFFPQSINDLRLLLGFSTFGLDQTAASTYVEPASNDDVLSGAITWRSAPELRARTLIANPNLLRPIVTTAELQGIIQRVRGRAGTQALIIGAWMSHPANAQWQNWPYFDYLIYRLIADAAGADRVFSFADYPQSPTPERPYRWAIAGGGIGFLIISGIVYYGARRWLYLHPEPARVPLSEAPQTEVDGVDGALQKPWQQAGFHRPLAGFLTYLPFGLLLAIPLFIYRHVLLPDTLIVDPLGYNDWQTVGQWTLALWTLLDAGVGVAAVRYYATTHRHWPRQAPKYLQFYVWWQFLSGAVQVGLIAILTITALPVLGLAHLSYYLLAQAVLQFPGFLQVFALSFRARQRLDTEQLLMVFGQILTPLLQTAFVLALRPWGAATHEFTQGISAAFGLSAGLLAARTLTFILGAWLYRRIGEPLSSLFLPTFNRSIASDALRFGIPWSIGAAMPAIGAIAQLLLFEHLLAPNSTIAMRGRALLEITVIFEVLLTSLYQGLMPALCEAATFRYKTLLRYYVSQAIRYGVWFSFFIFGLVSALAPLMLTLIPRFDQIPPEGSPLPQLSTWILMIAAWGALRWAVWLPNRMLEAAGKPVAIIWLALAEQALRIAGLTLLFQRWGFLGVAVAYTIAMLIRIILGRWLSGRYLVKTRIHIWQSLVAPAVAALSVYQLLKLVGVIAAPQTWEGTVALILGAALPALLFYGFLTVMFGGWDNGSLAEFRKAMRISGLGRPFAWLLYRIMALGARFSPLHDRFPIALYDQAQDEAAALTFARSQEL
jgi:O-antigen/teichoic acid export membrane protein